MAMSEPANRAPNCQGCIFWERGRAEKEGVCRLRAPRPSVRSDEVAHWPQTHGEQWCAEGVASPSLATRTRCSACLYWRRPDSGIDPSDRRDMPKAWWGGAGRCARRAPRPSSEPGARTFWRATHGEDSCGQGCLISS
jgi:hypothetical protein